MFAGVIPQRLPAGWVVCDGSALSISEYQELYALLGTTYGGDGRSTFGIPDLRGRIPLGTGSGVGLTPRVLGQSFGTEAVTLTIANIPAHTHALMASTQTASINVPGPTAVLANTNGIIVQTKPVNAFQEQAKVVKSTTMDSAAINDIGGNSDHDNMMPFLAINFIIATSGIYPTSNN
jgi:microcystin-dependent protein